MKLAESLGMIFETHDEAAQQPASDASMRLSRVKNVRISLKQWRMFHAVVDYDGFAEAAEKLHVSQSSISHALAKLQEQLGISLLSLKGRKAHITEEGRILLERSRELVRNALEIEELAEHLRQGWGPEIRLAVDPNFPSELLTEALSKLASQSCRVRLSVREAAPLEANQAIHQDIVDFAICATPIQGFVSAELVDIEYVAIAHPDNPLFALNRELHINDLKTQPRVAVPGYCDYPPSDPHHSHQHSVREWNVDNLDRALTMLGKGLGYAWLPRYRLQRCLESNSLRVLPMDRASGYTIRLYLILGRSATTSPKALRFAEALRSTGARWLSER